MDKSSWIIEGEVGTSSKTMWLALMGIVTRPRRLDSFEVGIPHDPDDFRRCLLLIEAVPEWEGQLQKVADVFPAWQPYIREWQTMKRLYQEESPYGKCPRLYDFMKVMEDESRLADGWKKTGPGSWERETIEV